MIQSVVHLPPPAVQSRTFHPLRPPTPSLHSLPPPLAAAFSPSRGQVREVIDLVNSDDDDDDDDEGAAAVSSVATAESRVKLESGQIESLPQVKLEAIAVMRGALPIRKLSESQLWELLSAHGHDAAAAIQAHILAQFAIGRPAQDQ